MPPGGVSGATPTLGHSSLTCDLVVKRLGSTKKKFFQKNAIFPITSIFFLTYAKDPRSIGHPWKKINLFEIFTFRKQSGPFFITILNEKPY